MRARWVALSFSVIFHVVHVDDVRAEDTAVTGFAACRELEAKNQSELAMWTAAQPAKPFAYTGRETVLDAPWTELGRAFGHSAALLLATAVPHMGVGFRSSQPEFVIAWPLSVSIGPALSCSRKNGTFEIDKSRPNRFLFEPAIWAADAGTTFSLRPGYRFLWHPTNLLLGFVGAGAGIGSTIELARPRSMPPANSQPRASLSPEIVFQLGSCCSPGYVMLTTRFDFFFDGPSTPFAFSQTMGFTYF
jgi:hypothetical protein